MAVKISSPSSPSPSPTKPVDEPAIHFWGSQTGTKGVPPLAYTGSPLRLFIADIKNFFTYIRFLPLIMFPLSPYGSAHLDELYPSIENLWNMFLHLVLCVLQLAFLVSIPIWFVLPVWMVFTFVCTFLISNEIFCYLLNGFKSVYQSNPALVKDFPARPNEQWLFLNGVAVGKHWLQSNIDRLSITFGRPVLGVHNRTSGIIFDVIQCLIQRNFTFATSDVRDCYAIIKKTLYSPCTKVVLILHSQGGIEGGMIIDWLLQECPQELLSKLEVYTFGCAANHFNNPHRHIRSRTLAKSTPATAASLHATQLPTTDTTTSTTKPLSNSAPLPPLLIPSSFPSRTHESTIRHIEHYANNSDFVARWGVLSCVCDYSSSPSAPHFRGRVFERPGAGHQFNQHYLDNMFPLNEAKTGCAETSGFMEMPIVRGGDGEKDLLRDVRGAREGLVESWRGVDGLRGLGMGVSWGEEGQSSSDEEGKGGDDDDNEKMEAVLRDVDGFDGASAVLSAAPVVNGMSKANGSPTQQKKSPPGFKVKHLSRLWLYRNGRCPPEEEQSASTAGGLVNGKGVGRMATL